MEVTRRTFFHGGERKEKKEEKKNPEANKTLTGIEPFSSGFSSTRRDATPPSAAYKNTVDVCFCPGVASGLARERWIIKALCRITCKLLAFSFSLPHLPTAESDQIYIILDQHFRPPRKWIFIWAEIIARSSLAVVTHLLTKEGGKCSFGYSGDELIIRERKKEKLFFSNMLLNYEKRHQLLKKCNTKFFEALNSCEHFVCWFSDKR